MVYRKECDELRTLESKILEKKVAESRAVQIQEQEERKVIERKEKKFYDDLWEQDRLKKIQREEEDRKHQKAINDEMIHMLGQQQAALKLQAEHEEYLKKEEARIMVKPKHALHIKESNAFLMKLEKRFGIANVGR